jgi:hypothetical protein
MKKKIAAITLATIIASYVVVQQAEAKNNAIGSINLSSRVQLNQIRAAKNSTALLGSMRLRGSNLDSLNAKTQVRIGGPVQLKRNAQLRMGAIDLYNARIGGSATFQTNVNVQKGVYQDEDSEVGMGGIQITADNNYNPQVFHDTSSQGNLLNSTNSLNNLYGNSSLNRSSSILDSIGGANAASQWNRLNGQKIHQIPGNMISSTTQVDKYHLLAQMSEDVYGKSNELSIPKDWVKVHDTDTGNTSADKEMRRTGGHAVVYYNKKINEVVTVFEGTKLTSLKDESANIAQRFIIPPQYQAASEVLENVWKDVRKHNPEAKMVVTGHSLGGGLSQFAGADLAIKHSAANVEGVVFNAADLGIYADQYLWRNEKKMDNISMTHIRVNGDSVSGFGGLVRMDDVFTNYTEYELPTFDGVISDHGIKEIREHIGGHKSDFESYKKKG